MGSLAVAEGRDEEARRLPFGRMVDVEDRRSKKVWKTRVEADEALGHDGL